MSVRPSYTSPSPASSRNPANDDVLGAETVIYRFDKLESTQTTLLRMVEEGAGHGTTVMARQQTAGRGRQGRDWHSPEGNLYFSVFWQPARERADWSTLPLVAGLGVADALQALSPASDSNHEMLQLKWPNDILIGGHKTGGILLQQAGAGVMVGIGINMLHYPEQMPYPVTSLKDAGYRVLSPDRLLQRLLEALELRFKQWQESGFASLKTDWERAALPKNSPIAVRLPDAALEGSYMGIDSRGGLLLRLTNDEVRVVTAGDIFPLAALKDPVAPAERCADAAGH